MKFSYVKSAKLEDEYIEWNEDQRFGFCWFLMLPRFRAWRRHRWERGGASVNWLCYRLQLNW